MVEEHYEYYKQVMKAAGLEDEILAIIALTPEQVIRDPERKPALAELIDEGARIVASTEPLDSQTRLYPLGTARALAYVVRHTQSLPPAVPSCSSGAS